MKTRKLAAAHLSVTLLLVLAGAFSARAILPPQLEELPNFDRRAPVEPSSLASARGAGLAALNTRLPGAIVDFDELARPKWVHARHGFLTGTNGQGGAVSAETRARFAVSERYATTKAFLREHSGLFGFGTEALDAARVAREFTTAHNGMETVVWQQELDGISVFEAVFISHTTKRGELVNVASQFVPSLTDAATAHRNWIVAGNAPPITPRQAVVLAAGNLGEDLAETNVTSTEAIVPTDGERKQSFTAQRLAGPADVKLVWLPMSQASMRLCWEVVLTIQVRGEMYRVLVDTESGEPLVRHRLTEYISDATYRIFPSDSPSPFSPGCPNLCTTQPPLTSPVLVTLSALDTNASPAGWIDDGVNETRGNNVDAHTDRNADNLADLPRPQGSPFRTFDFPIDLTQAPSTYTNAAVTDLFYWCNWTHDQLYLLGFTEAAGNFQNNNFGRGGLGNDALQADAQDGSGFNNANMSTPSDGSAPRMQMYIFNGPTPDRDGDFDHEIVIHEYVHGLSNRRVGGGLGLSASQSRGMGEGWSDWYGLALLSEPADDPHATYAAGGYATYQFSTLGTTNYYFGIRRYPYSTDMTKNPLTFRDIDPAQASTHPGVPRSPLGGGSASEVHNQGEVWCVALWDARANLITKYGHTNGNQIILRLVTDGMNLSPSNPNFLQARDGILQADIVNHGGANHPQLWAAFAKRGMGHSATSPSSATTTGVVEAYDIPDTLTVSPGNGFTATGPVGGPFTPNATTFTLLNLATNSLNWTATATANWLTLTQTTGTIVPNGSNVITVSLNANALTLPQGNYTATLHFTNQQTTVTHTRTFILRAGQTDYFTELFDTAGNDLDYQTLTFTPNGSGSHYTVCREPATTYPSPITGATVLSLTSHTFIPLSLASNVTIYNTSASTIYLASEGHLTWLTGDSSGSMTLANHFSRPRVSASLAHLHPGEGGGRVLWQPLSNRVAITFDRVLEYGTANTNNFQIELFYDGRIRMTHLFCATTTGLVGLSAGTGVPADFLESDLSSYGPCALPLTLSAPTNAVEGAGPLSAQLSLLSPAITNVVIALASSDATELTTPPTVTLLAGTVSTNFPLTIVDDTELDGTQLAFITASAPGYLTASAPVPVADNESATLAWTIAPSATEGDAPLLATLHASAPPTANIPITLSSSDTTELQVPPTVTLSAGQTSAVFAVSVVNDFQIDGPQPVTLTARVANWTDALANITVLDNEPTHLTVTLPLSAREGAGTLINAGSVRIGGTLTTNLPVALASGDLTELTVAASTTILAGQTNAFFNLTIVDDPDIDSSQPVSVTASAPGFADGITDLIVTDNESPPEPFNPNPPHLATNVIQTTALAWANGAMPGEFITNEVYFGTSPTLGPSELLGSTTGTNWTLPLLAPQTTYYWQVVARKTGVTPGPVWRFTTRGVDRLVWSSIAGTQYVSQPFNVTVTAKDAFDTTVTNFAGPVQLSAGGAGNFTNVIFGNAVHTVSSSGNYTLAFGFTPNTNITVTHVRSYAGTKVSLWTTNGTLLASQNVSGPLATWTDTPLATPLNLSAGVTYLAGFYTGGSSSNYYYHESRPLTFPNGSVVSAYYYATGDTFPDTVYTANSVLFLCDLRYTVTGQSGVLLSLTNAGPFVNGEWTGNLSVLSPTTNCVLRADDGQGHSGVSGAFQVQLRDDVSVAMTDAPDPVSLGGNVTYSITVTNSGPSSATGVWVTNILSPGASFVSASSSQGSMNTNGNPLLFDLGTLADDSYATISVVARATNMGTLLNRVFVSRAEPDAFAANNSAETLTTVQTPAISIADASVFEGNSGTKGMDFVVSISPVPAFPASVAFATANGTAAAPGDFISTNGFLMFAPGESNQVLSVHVVGEGAYEPNESFTVNLSAVTNATLMDSVATGNILNDDAMPTLSISDATLIEGNVGRTNAVFTISLSSPSGSGVSVYVNTVDGNAQNGSDYIYTNSYIAFPPGATSTNIAVSINGDLQIENDEVFYADLYSASGAILLKREGIGLILNDDGLPGNVDRFAWSAIASPQFVGQPFNVTINALDAFNNPAVNFNGPATLRAAGGSGTTNVLGNGTSSASLPIYTGYTAERTQVIYPASEVGPPGLIGALALDVSALPGIALNNWTVRLKHTPLTNYNSFVWEGSNWTVVQVTNLVVSSTGWLMLPFTTPFYFDGTNSLMVDFSFYNSSTYGDGSCRATSRSSTRTMYYYSSAYGNPLLWSGTSPSPYTTTYTPNLLVIRAGELTSIEPAVTGMFTNGVWSGALTALSPTTNAALVVEDGAGHAGLSGSFAVNLINDLGIAVVDSPDPVGVGTALNYSIYVTNIGPAAATGVRVTNQLPASVALVSVASSQGSVTNFGQTVVGDLGTINGSSAATISIVGTPSAVGSITNIALVSRAGADNYLLNNSATNHTLVVLPALSVNDISVTEPVGGSTNAVFSVSLSVPSALTVAVNYATTNGSASAGSDYAAASGSLSFAPGETNKLVTVLVFDDALFEGTETFALILSAPSNANLLKPIGAAAILDNEGPPDFRILNLLTNNSRVVDHNALTGDDRGGVAISGSQVFVTGDNATARFNASDLTSGASLGVVRDGLCTDLQTEKVYLLGNGSTPLTSSGGTVSSLIELNDTGSPSGVVIPLSQSFSMTSSGHGFFSGYGRIVIFNNSNSRVYDIFLPSGFVSVRGTMPRPNMQAAEGWACWGVAEFFGGDLYLAFRESGFQRISRARVPDGATSVIASFSNLSDLPCFVVSPSRSRWFFSYEGSGQFGGATETLGYADAQLVFTAPPVIFAQPANQLVSPGGAAAFTVGASGSAPLAFQWRRFGTNLSEGGNISGANSNALWVLNVQTNDAGFYSVAVSNAFGWAVSSNAVLALDVPLPPATPCCPTPPDLATVVSTHAGLAWGGGSNVFSSLDLGHPVFSPFSSSSIGAEDRSVAVLMNASASVSALGIKAQFVSPTTLSVTIRSVAGTSRGAVLASASVAVGAAAPLGFVEVPIAFSFVAGQVYDIGFNITGGWGSQGMEFYDFHNPTLSASGGYSVGAFRVLDGAAGGFYANTVMPHVRATMGAGAGGLTSYAVWMGTNAGGLSLVASNLAEASFDPGALAFDTDYFWQVVATNAVGSSTGAVWQFSTAADQVGFAATALAVAEGAGVASVSVSRENPVGALVVEFFTTNGTASAGADYSAVAGSLVFPAGVTSTNFVVPILEDGSSEGSETVLLRLHVAGTNGVLVSPAEGVLTILDNDALAVSVFADGAFVDVTTTTGGETTNVIAAVLAKGAQVRTFTGITPAAFSNALTGAAVLLIPDLEVGDLGSSLTAAAKGVISNFVMTGGELIIHGEGGSRDENFMNQVFGYSILMASSSTSSLLTSAAAGTAFAGGPASLSENNGTYEWLRSSLPAGSLSIYQDSGASYTTVAVIPRGAGRIVFLAYDWFDAVPRGSQNGGWDEALRRALLVSSGPVAPVITNQPASQSFVVGQNVSLNVGVSGTAPLFYQWRKGGSPLANQTNATLTFINAQTNVAGTYSVAVSNSYGSMTSSNAVLAVVASPQLRFLAPERVGGGLRLRLTTVDSSPIPAARASNVWVYASTNIAKPLSNWTAIANAPVLTNGVLVIDGINATNPPVQFFRAIEGAWNVGPLRLHSPMRSGDGWLLRATPPDGSLLTPMRSAKVKFYASTNLALPFSSWQPLTGATMLSNGVCCLSVPVATNAPTVYFRAEEER